MKHIHFKEIASTQRYLCNNKHLIQHKCLISCDQQVDGIGQYNRKWDSSKSSLCFSFSLSPNPKLALSSLELACLLVGYFKTTYGVTLKLKWPNDILTVDGRKVGGILLNNFSGFLAVGVGLNFFNNNEDISYPTPFGYIFDQTFEFDQKSAAKKIYLYVLANRLSSQDTLQTWAINCIHINKSVTFIDGETIYKGIFIGTGKNGEALIRLKDGREVSFYSGSIRI